MNNAILFNFDINVSNVRRINNNYYFKHIDNNYGIFLYDRNVEDSIFLYYLNNELLVNGLNGYKIITTKVGSVVFNYDNKNYVLMQFPTIQNRKITYQDIIEFSFDIDDSKYKKIDKSDWSISWSNKIDFIIYQFSQMQTKYKKIDTYIDYFIGIFENAISYFNNNVTFIQKKVVCHKRVDVNMNLYDFLNPLNFVIDYKERDIGEYLKSYVVTKNFTLSSFDKILNGLSKENIILLISRILFPSYFFDVYEKIIIDKVKEEEIINITKKSQNVINLLKYIFNKYSSYNIPYIEWIKKSD